MNKERALSMSNEEILKELQSIEYNTFNSWCSHCESEETLINEFKIYHCVECGERMLPCVICDIEDCCKCPFHEGK